MASGGWRAAYKATGDKILEYDSKPFSIVLILDGKPPLVYNSLVPKSPYMNKALLPR